MYMSDVVEISNIKIVQDQPPNRRVYVADFEEPLQFGIHGGVKDFYKKEVEEEHPSTLDHIVAAAGG